MLGISGFVLVLLWIMSFVREGGECLYIFYVFFWVRSVFEGEYFDWVVGKWKYKLM